MDPQVIQRARYVLRTRFRRAQTCPPALFPSACKQLLSWLENHPVLSSLVTRLASMATESREQIDKIIADVIAGRVCSGFYAATSTEEHAALCLHTARALTMTGELQGYLRDSAFTGLAEYLTEDHFERAEDAIKPLRDVAIDGLYEYLDEQIDTRNVIYPAFPF
jgi:hypothetical protein